MRKFYVVAKKWDDMAQKQVEYVAGEFPDWINARIFRDAYNEYYNAYNEYYSVTAEIVEVNISNMYNKIIDK